MSGYPGGHLVFLTVALTTHALIGATLGTVLFDRPWAGLLGGVVADIDLLFPAAWPDPFVHRGITHTALLGGVAAALSGRRDRRTAGAVGVGYASHLLVDTTTPMGVPLAYPLSTASVGVDLAGHSPAATAALWVGCLALLAAHRL